MAAIDVAAGASARRLARHLRRRHARARAGSFAARSRASRPAGTGAAAAAGIRADAGAISARADLRAARRARQAARAQYRDTLARIEKEFGVPGNVVLAIWARETDYGGYKLPLDAIRTLATQGFVGKRKDFFRNEFLHALKMLQDGVPRADMRSSWGGAMGLTQFLPSEFYKYAVDFDGDGRADIWRSVPDALASAAKQLAGKGWQAGKPWAIEVRVPATIDCTIAEPGVTLGIGEWLKRGLVPAYNRKLTPKELAIEASLLLPEGTYGPAFLTPKNYYVIKEYNFSDLYVLFVGHLSDRIAGARAFETPWSKNAQLKTSDVESMQRRLTALGLYKDKIDGKAGMLTRSALGAYQKNKRPEGRLLADRGGARPHAAVIFFL